MSTPSQRRDQSPCLPGICRRVSSYRDAAARSRFHPTRLTRGNHASNNVEHDRSRAFVTEVADDNWWYVFKIEVGYSSWRVGWPPDLLDGVRAHSSKKGQLRLWPGSSPGGRRVTGGHRADLLRDRARLIAQRVLREGQAAPGLPRAHRIRYAEAAADRRAWLGACRRVGVWPRLRHDFRRTAVRDL